MQEPSMRITFEEGNLMLYFLSHGKYTGAVEVSSRSGSAAGFFGTSSAALHHNYTNLGTFSRKGALQSGAV